ncbi:uncharacterized protein LOC124130951 [Haliotis rufescens]|uniref:uncharacterized protein LOC124130951 n=1 Tax=Haliotis rufescens TaxID=6454 RepID=UPI00201EAFC8|nr:uncharacterized protein LOC124130951 [Haliotis rufescens]
MHINSAREKRVHWDESITDNTDRSHPPNSPPDPPERKKRRSRPTVLKDFQTAKEKVVELIYETRCLQRQCYQLTADFSKLEDDFTIIQKASSQIKELLRKGEPPFTRKSLFNVDGVISRVLYPGEKLVLDVAEPLVADRGRPHQEILYY